MARHADPVRRWPLLAAGLSLALVLTAIVVLSRRGPESPVVLGPPAMQTTAAVPGRRLYVDPQGAAVQQVTQWQSEGRFADAATLRHIAAQPTATWFADNSSGFARRAANLAENAAEAGRLPVVALYNIPGRDCAGQSAGGAPDAANYRAWVRTMAASLQGHEAVVILEPDAVPQAVQGCLAPNVADERYDLLAEAVDTLRVLPGVLVYLDAGNPGWITDPARLVTALRRSGVTRAAGFALNVAGFETTADNVAYGNRLSALLGGAHYVVDTSRNGNGPARGNTGARRWCNPPGRALGATPTTRTGVPLADAYLWIKRPGESDGPCGQGAPGAGQWWPEYALSLART